MFEVSLCSSCGPRLCDFADGGFTCLFTSSSSVANRFTFPMRPTTITVIKKPLQNTKDGFLTRSS